MVTHRLCLVAAALALAAAPALNAPAQRPSTRGPAPGAAGPRAAGPRTAGPRAAEGAIRFEPRPRAALAEVGLAVSRDPKLIVSASGTVYLLAAYADGAQMRLGLAISHDGGDTFAPPVPISEAGASVSSHGENSPSLAATPTEIYALWEQRAAYGTELMFARSLSWGHSFEKPVRVADKPAPSFNGFSCLGVAPDGAVYAAWLDGRDPAETEDTFSLYVAKSTDRGATFGRNARVAGAACPCCRPSIAFGAGGEVFVAWRRVFPGDVRDVVVSTSRDGGATFSAPARVAEDNWRLPGCPHSGPAAATLGKRLVVGWYSEGGKLPAGIRTAYSEDGARSFSAPVHASGGVLDANHPALSASADGALVLVFQGRDPDASAGWGGQRVHAVRLGGSPGMPTRIDSEAKSVAYPAVAAGTAGRVFVAWTEPGSGGPAVAFSRGRAR